MKLLDVMVVYFDTDGEVRVEETVALKLPVVDGIGLKPGACTWQSWALSNPVVLCSEREYIELLGKVCSLKKTYFSGPGRWLREQGIALSDGSISSMSR